MLAYKGGPQVRLISRRDVEHSRRYRELAAVIATMTPATLVLDGRSPSSTSSSASPLLVAFDIRLP
jgi:hypothetical protein